MTLDIIQELHFSHTLLYHNFLYLVKLFRPAVDKVLESSRCKEVTPLQNFSWAFPDFSGTIDVMTTFVNYITFIIISLYMYALFCTTKTDRKCSFLNGLSLPKRREYCVFSRLLNNFSCT